MSLCGKSRNARDRRLVLSVPMRPFMIVALFVPAVACGGDDGPGDGDGGGGGDSDADGLDGPQDARMSTDDAGTMAPGSLRLYGTGKNGIDRAEIQIDPHVPADVGAGTFTIELWIRRDPLATLVPGPCSATGNGWIAGNVILDRDVRGTAVNGEFGLSLVGGKLAFGLTRGGQSAGICGTATVPSGWNHVAITRDSSSGAIVVYLQGVVDGTVTGPTGDLSYANGVQGDPKDPFLVVGAEKFDLGGQHPAFSGWVDELRLSTTVRYTAAFDPAIAPFDVDADTAALYHFDDGDGANLGEVRGMSPGQIRVGLDDNGSTVPTWASATPFLI